MKQTLGALSLFIALLIVSAPIFAAETEEQPVLPKDLLDLEQWKGKVLLVDFWASWCGPCRQSFPWMAEMQQKYMDRGLIILTVNLDEERAAADQFLSAFPYDFEYVFDSAGRLAAAFDLRVMPSSFLFDRQGNLSYRHSGFRSEMIAEYEKHIVMALEDKVVEPDPFLAKDSPAPGYRFGVRPWQRGFLAKEGMLLDNDPLDFAFDDHIYFSKEASSGGRGYGGGGCGCN